jgi:hypothetical protein
MSSFVTSIPVPPVSKEFIKALSDAFRPYEIKPGFDRDELMQSVGEQKVIDWITHHALQGRTITGEPTAVRSVMPTGAIVKLGE